jgi:hypothetical protein
MLGHASCLAQLKRSRSPSALKVTRPFGYVQVAHGRIERTLLRGNMLRGGSSRPYDACAAKMHGACHRTNGLRHRDIRVARSPGCRGHPRISLRRQLNDVTVVMDRRGENLEMGSSQARAWAKQIADVV